MLVLKSVRRQICGLNCILPALLLLPAAASAQTCTSLFQPLPLTTQILSPAGGNWFQQITFSATCAWNISADVPWITFPSTTSGSGFPRQTIFFSAKVSPNNGPAPLHGTITLTAGSALQQFPIVVLSNSCAYNVDPPSAQFGAQGGSGQFTVTATPTDCLPFDPNSSYSVQLTASARAIYDHGIFYYGIPPNSGPALSATATLSSQPSVTFTLTQDGGDGQFRAGCPLNGVPRVGVTFPAQCVAVGGTQPYNWSLTGGSFPNGVGLSAFPPTSLGGTPTTEGPFSFELTATDSSSPPQTAKVTVSGVVQPALVSVNCSTNTGPQQTGVFYFAACEAKGGTGSYLWSIRTGALPNGLTMSPGPAGGIIVSGTPTDSTPYYYLLQAADTSQPMPLTTSVLFTGTPSSTVPALTINCGVSGVFNISQNVPFNLICTPSGGLRTYQYSILSGNLPPGLTTSGNSALSLYISGAPNTPGEFKFTVQIASNLAPTQTAQQDLDIVVSPALALKCTLVDGPIRAGQAYTNTCTASGGQPPYTISTDVNSLPSGLSFVQDSSTTGTVSGTPTTGTGFSFYVMVSDSSHALASVSFLGRIDSSTGPASLRLSCSPSTLTKLEVGVPIAPVQCMVTSGTPPYIWHAPNGLLGLSLTATGNTALLNGAPTTTGTFEGFFVTDSSTPQPQSANWIPSGMSISPRLSMTCNPADSPTSVGQVFSSSCSTSGGASPIAWTTSGSLPPGLTYTASTFGLPSAAVSGSPTTPGPYAFTITLQDSASPPVTLSQTLSGTILPVGAGLFLECSTSNGNYTGGVAINPVTCRVSGGSPPYQWSISSGSLPLGLSIASVTAGAAVEGIPTVAGNYTYTLAASDSSGQTATWPVSVSIANPYAPVGLSPVVLSDLVFGDGWQSRMVLASLYGADTASLRFFGNSGNPVGVPYQQVATGSSSTASFIDYKLPENGVVFLDTVTNAAAPLTTGSAQLSSLYNRITGFGVFRYPSRNWEALVPIDGTRDNSYVVAFDNTGSAWTGVALASSSADSLKLAATVRDESGAVLETASIPMGPSAQTSITLSQQFSSTAGKRGTVQFTSDAFGTFHALAVRGNGAALTTLPVLPVNGYAYGGTIAHMAFYGGYISTFVLVNTGTSATSFTLKFFDDAGKALNVPLFVPQAGGDITVNTLTLPLAAGATVSIQTQSNDSLQVVSGSAQLVPLGEVSGFALFRWTTYGQEASVPFQTSSSSSGLGRRLVFDNTGGFTTGVGISNPFGLASDITVNIRDEGGNLLQTSTITLPTNGHTAFMLPFTYPATAGIRGSVEFVTPFIQPAVIGLRVGPNFTLTTIPAL